MFKAKLIEDQYYYHLKRQQLLISLLPSGTLWLISFFVSFSTWFILLVLGLNILLIFWAFKGQKRINFIFGNKLLEMDDSQIRIRTKKGVQIERFSLNEVEKIIIKEKYVMPQDSINALRKEIGGEVNQNYIILQYSNNKRELYFEIDSYYMMNQLNKIINKWYTKGYSIQKIPNEWVKL